MIMTDDTVQNSITASGTWSRPGTTVPATSPRRARRPTRSGWEASPGSELPYVLVGHRPVGSGAAGD